VEKKSRGKEYQVGPHEFARVTCERGHVRNFVAFARLGVGYLFTLEMETCADCGPAPGEVVVEFFEHGP